MRRIKSGEAGAVDLGSVDGSGVSPGMKEITPERAAELSAAHDNAPKFGEATGITVVPPPNMTVEAREQVAQEASANLQDITIESPSEMCCPNCGHRLSIDVKFYGSMRGAGGH
jgi:hypothetical protein